MAYREPARTTNRRPPRRATAGRIPRFLVAGLLVVIASITGSLGYRLLASASPTAASPDGVRGARGEALPGTVWPAYGQAAVQIGQSQVRAGPNQHPAPIASVAKVMTAYLVLRDHPLRPGEDGPTITLKDADVADTDRRGGRTEPGGPPAAGERWTDSRARQAR